MKFLELRKNLKKDFSGLRAINIFLMGDSAMQFIAQGVRGQGYLAGFDLCITEADYGQHERYIVDENSELYISKPHYVILILTTQKLLKRFYKLSLEERTNFAESILSEMMFMVEKISSVMPECRVVISNFIEINDGVFGNFANKICHSFLYQLRKINLELMNLAAGHPYLDVCDLSSSASQLGIRNVIDNRIYIEADMAFGVEFIPSISENVLSIIKTYSGIIIKCIIFDLDNTLWGGIIGDDGIEGIQIGDLGIGKAFSELQSWAKEMRKRGIIIAICSKNDEATAKNAFENHPDMVLSIDDVAIFIANWDSKVSNIIKIREFLNIGSDAIVFIDDNPFERELVKKHFPTMVVPDLPEDAVDYLPFLREQNIFETSSFTKEDAERTAHFKQELKRELSLKSFTDEGEFLRDLNMTCAVSGLTAFNIPRASQLLQRSNQFNLRTIRYSEIDLKNLQKNIGTIAWNFSLNDRFGAYGLISVVIGEIRNKILFLDNWVMSCRVLRRGVEQLALNEIVRFAKMRELETIVGEYIATAKNGLVKDHFQNLGFALTDSGLWTLDVKSFSARSHFITIVD